MIGWLCHLMLWCVFFLVYEHPDKNTHSNHHPILGSSIIQNKKSPSEIKLHSGEKRGWKPHPRPLIASLRLRHLSPVGERVRSASEGGEEGVVSL